MLSGPIQYQRPPGEDEQDYGLARGDNSLKQLLLVSGQVQVSTRRGFAAHVARLTQGEDGDIGILGGGNRSGEAGVRSAGDLSSLLIRKDRSTLLGSFHHGGAQGTHIAEVVCSRPGANHVAGIVSE